MAARSSGCCYLCFHWYYTSFCSIFFKDYKEDIVVFVDNPLHSSFIEKCHICGSNTNPESILLYHARNPNMIVKESTVLCDKCIQRMYYKIDGDIRYTKL